MGEQQSLSFSGLRAFSFQERVAQVRTLIDTKGEPWFVAKDVCDILEISNSRDAISRLDDDEKGVAQTDTLGGLQDVNIINESGLYGLIFRSDKPQAKAFRKWVTSEVLPAIRKFGRYGFDRGQAIPENPEQRLALLAHSQRQRRELQGRINELRKVERQCLDRMLLTAPPFFAELTLEA